jgi:hypothetical protein
VGVGWAAAGVGGWALIGGQASWLRRVGHGWVGHGWLRLATTVPSTRKLKNGSRGLNTCKCGRIADERQTV